MDALFEAEGLCKARRRLVASRGVVEFVLETVRVSARSCAVPPDGLTWAVLASDGTADYIDHIGIR